MVLYLERPESGHFSVPRPLVQPPRGASGPRPRAKTTASGISNRLQHIISHFCSDIQVFARK